ncbi:hypothetical protein [Thetidibacter halocola]|uniref:Uncharacterized protein n=1 Tax=Thetidibacter halocola TaxID=2827239 RepID=A0A8J7WBK4_9RHOB|nr:hypothetical protein [Thetidibacter halocola]MBS0123419.1 hypothetical protein [Thetidibacter halocola]
MKTETHQIARARNTAIDLRENTVVRVVPKDGARFAGKAAVAYEDNAIVFAYADGTTVSLTI